MQATQGSLTLVNTHTDAPQVFWNGKQVDGVLRVHVHNDEDEHRVKLVVLGADEEAIASMIAGGVHVRRAA